MEAYNTGYSQTVTHPTTNPTRQDLTFVIELELVEVSMVVEKGELNFYFTLIWVSCVGLVPLRNKSVYFLSKN